MSAHHHFHDATYEKASGLKCNHCDTFYAGQRSESRLQTHLDTCTRYNNSNDILIPRELNVDEPWKYAWNTCFGGGDSHREFRKTLGIFDLFDLVARGWTVLQHKLRSSRTRKLAGRLSDFRKHRKAQHEQVLTEKIEQIEAGYEKCLQDMQNLLATETDNILSEETESNRIALASAQLECERVEKANLQLIQCEISRGELNVTTKQVEALEQTKKQHEQSLESLIRRRQQLLDAMTQCQISQTTLEEKMSLLDFSYWLFDPEEQGEDENRRNIILLGNTGDGKSTLGNRLFGDDSRRGNQGPFTTSGGATSVTTNVSSCLVDALDEKFCVVDTPGMGDSQGDEADLSHANKIISYLRGVKTINAFIFVRNYRKSRLTGPDRELLGGLAELLGADFWRNVMFVFTRVDDEDDEEDFEEDKNSFRDDVSAQFQLGNYVGEIPFVGIGKRNYDQQRLRILELASKYKKPFSCEHLVLPLEIVERECEEIITQQQQIQQDLETVNAEINGLQSVINEADKHLERLKA